MSPGAPTIRWPGQRGQARDSVIWPSLVAILFATFAAISFAVDHSVTESNLANLPIEAEAQ
jgi:hypothetical protein